MENTDTRAAKKQEEDPSPFSRTHTHTRKHHTTSIWSGCHLSFPFLQYIILQIFFPFVSLFFTRSNNTTDTDTPFHMIINLSLSLLFAGRDYGFIDPSLTGSAKTTTTTHTLFHRSSPILFLHPLEFVTSVCLVAFFSLPPPLSSSDIRWSLFPCVGEEVEEDGKVMSGRWGGLMFLATCHPSLRSPRFDTWFPTRWTRLSLSLSSIDRQWHTTELKTNKENY